MKAKRMLACILSAIVTLSSLPSLTFRVSAVSVATNYATAAQEIDDSYAYNGTDLGVTYTPEATTFKVWSPTAEAVSVNF